MEDKKRKEQEYKKREFDEDIYLEMKVKEDLKKMNN
jgi:hypothetical protein